MQFKAVNSELVGSCTALKSRVDEVSSLQGLMSRSGAATTVRPLTGEDDIAQAATTIVEESMTEAATLVHNLFQQHHQKRSSEAPASGSAAAGGPPVESTDPGKLPTSSGAQENGKQGACKSGAEQESGAVPTPPETSAACAPLPIVKQEAQVTTGSLATTPRGSQSPPAAAEIPSSLALLVDDESLMHMSTKLTAMFIAIQRYEHAVATSFPHILCFTVQDRCIICVQVCGLVSRCENCATSTNQACGRPETSKQSE